jgi:nicotinamidase-related amidase
MTDMTIPRDSAVLLVHDVVNCFIDPMRPSYDAQIPGVLQNIEMLLEAARHARIPVVFAAPGPGEGVGPRPSTEKAGEVLWGTPACDVPERLGPMPDDILLRKPRYGAFYGSRLTAILRDMRRDLLIVCGISLAGGVETTIRDAQNRDLRTILVSDACLSRPVSDRGWGPVSRAEVEKVTFSIIAERFARVLATTEICDQLKPGA